VTGITLNHNTWGLVLIMQRPLGLISLLDEECMFPRASDLTLANKLKEHLKGNDCFKGERDKAFRVCHYASYNFLVFRAHENYASLLT
jgi:myosin-5